MALQAEVDNWRWSGVPFYLRTGKALAQGRQIITLGLAGADAADVPGGDARAGRAGRGNEIVIDFADPGSIAVRFLAKEPGPAMRLMDAEMTFRYADSFCAANQLEGYERLILEAMLGAPGPLHPVGRDRTALGAVDAPAGRTRRRCSRTPRAHGARPRRSALIAPHRWHLPDA